MRLEHVLREEKMLRDGPASEGGYVYYVARTQSKEQEFVSNAMTSAEVTND